MTLYRAIVDQHFHMYCILVSDFLWHITAIPTEVKSDCTYYTKDDEKECVHAGYQPD